MSFGWDKVLSVPVPGAATAEMAVTEEDGDDDIADDCPYGLNSQAPLFRCPSKGKSRLVASRIDDIKDKDFVVLRSPPSMEEDTSRFFVPGFDDIPLWLCKVLKVFQDRDNRKWRVSWYSPHGKGIKGSFHYLGAGYVDDLDVEEEFLVIRMPQLNKNKTIPHSIRREMEKVIKSAVVAEGNGNVCCVVCEEELKGEELVACGCCGQYYHANCSGVDRSQEEWWCDACQPAL